MRKILSLFAALLFAGSMMATEVQIYKNEGAEGTEGGVTATGNISTAASNGNPAPAFANTSTTKNGFVFEGFSLSGYANLRLSLDAKFASFPKTTETWPYLEVKFYKGSSVVQTDATTVSWSEKDNNYKTYSIAISADFDKIEMTGYPAEGKSGSGNPATNYALYVDNVILYGESSTPTITADNVDLGEVLYEPEGEYEHEISIDVVGANLTNDIEFSTTSTKLTIKTADALPPVGGALLVAIKTQACTLNEEIVLQSGTLQKKITISGKVFEKIYNPGTDATFVTPAETDSAYLVNGEDTPYTVYGAEAIKVGTGSKLGKAKIKVPATATKLYFMAAAYAGKPCNIAITAPEGVTLTNDSANNQGKTHLYADAGLNGDGPAYETAKGDWALYQYEIGLSGLTGETVIELASTARSSARFFVWNPTYEESAAPKSTDATIKSLTIDGVSVPENSGVFAYEVDADFSMLSVQVEFELNDPNATADPASEDGVFVEVPAQSDDTTRIYIEVTAEDGITNATYEIVVTRASDEPGDMTDATLAWVRADGELLEEDENHIYHYEVPANFAKQYVEITFQLNSSEATSNPAADDSYLMEVPASSEVEPTKLQITVTSGDGNTEIIYWVYLTRAAVTPEASKDVTIKWLKIDGVDVEEVEGVFAYESSFEAAGSNIPVTFELNDLKATANEESGFLVSVPASATAPAIERELVVTAEDPSVKKTYTISITVAPEQQGIEDIVLTEKAQKVVVDGAVYVIRDNKMFNVTGTRVR